MTSLPETLFCRERMDGLEREVYSCRSLPESIDDVMYIRGDVATVPEAVAEYLEGLIRADEREAAHLHTMKQMSWWEYAEHQQQVEVLRKWLNRLRKAAGPTIHPDPGVHGQPIVE